MKLCKDCIHYRGSPAPFISDECAAAPYIDPVDGRARHWACFTARMKGGPCAPDAKLFEPVNTQEAA